MIRSFDPVPPEARCLADAARWSPEGARLTYTHGGGVMVNAAWSPDGRWIAYVARESTWEANGELRIVGAGGRGDHRIASGDELGRLGNVDWQPR